MWLTWLNLVLNLVATVQQNKKNLMFIVQFQLGIKHLVLLETKVLSINKWHHLYIYEMS